MFFFKLFKILRGATFLYTRLLVISLQFYLNINHIFASYLCVTLHEFAQLHEKSQFSLIPNTIKLPL